VAVLGVFSIKIVLKISLAGLSLAVNYTGGRCSNVAVNTGLTVFLKLTLRYHKCMANKTSEKFGKIVYPFLTVISLCRMLV
jgi:hypothetical protein